MVLRGIHYADSSRGWYRLSMQVRQMQAGQRSACRHRGMRPYCLRLSRVQEAVPLPVCKRWTLPAHKLKEMCHQEGWAEVRPLACEIE